MFRDGDGSHFILRLPTLSSTDSGSDGGGSSTVVNPTALPLVAVSTIVIGSEILLLDLNWPVATPLEFVVVVLVAVPSAQGAPAASQLPTLSPLGLCSKVTLAPEDTSSFLLLYTVAVTSMQVPGVIVTVDAGGVMETDAGLLISETTVVCPTRFPPHEPSVVDHFRIRMRYSPLLC